MIEPVNLEAWAERHKDVYRRGHVRRTGESAPEANIERSYQSNLGASLEAALEHLPEGEEPIFVAFGKAFPSDAEELRKKDEAAGGPWRRFTVHGLIVVTRRRILAIEQYSSALQRLDQPRLHEHSVKMISHIKRHPTGMALLVGFGGSEMTYGVGIDDEFDRLALVLKELTGG